MKLSLVFDTKNGILARQAEMIQERANHCLAIEVKKGHSLTKKVFAAGGVYTTSYQNIHMRRPKLTYHNCKKVEVYDFFKNEWEFFGAELTIPRHNASMVYLNNFIYVVGGESLS